MGTAIVSKERYEVMEEIKMMQGVMYSVLTVKSPGERGI